jgi:hypothetical protein
MDLPFTLPQSRIFRAYGLTADLNMRYGADIRFIPEKLRYLLNPIDMGIDSHKLFLNF